jgi:hypothetical protein
VQSLCRLELSARIEELTIRDKPDLSPDELRASRHAIGQWTRERDNLLAALLGDAGGTVPDDPLAEILNATRAATGHRGPQPPQAGLEGVQPQGDATGATPAILGGNSA